MREMTVIEQEASMTTMARAVERVQTGANAGDTKKKRTQDGGRGQEKRRETRRNEAKV